MRHAHGIMAMSSGLAEIVARVLTLHRYRGAWKCGREESGR